MKNITVITFVIILLVGCGTVHTRQECRQLSVNSNYYCERYCMTDECKSICKENTNTESDKCFAGEKVGTSQQTLMAESAPGMALYAVTGALTGIGVGYSKHIMTFDLHLPKNTPEP